MVTNVTSLTGNGLKDWLIQRVSAIYFAVYALVVLGFIIFNQPLEYGVWQTLGQCAWFKIASVIAGLSFVLHAWIGIWTVTTDYIKCTVIRLSVQLLVALALLAQFVWVVMILWGQ